MGRGKKPLIKVAHQGASPAREPHCIKFHDGTREWRLDGKLHREDGPAIEWANGKRTWWLYGVQQEAPEIEASLLAPQMGPRSRISALANRESGR